MVDYCFDSAAAELLSSFSLRRRMGEMKSMAMFPVPFFGYCPGTPERNRNTVTNRISGRILFGY